MALLKRQIAYTKIGKIDPEELQSLRAQFLIYKGLQKADTRKSRPSWMRVKMTKLKIKIGNRLKKLRKGFSAARVFGAKVDLLKQIACVLKSCKYLVHGKHEQIVLRNLPPVF